MSSYLHKWLAPRCRLIATWGWTVLPRVRLFAG